MGQKDEELDSKFSALLAEVEKKGSEVLMKFVTVFRDSATTQAVCLTSKILLVPNTALKVLWEIKGLAIDGNPLKPYYGKWRNRMALESLNIRQEVTHYFPEAADIRRAQERMILTLSEMVAAYD